MSPRRHLAHLPSNQDNPIVFFTTSTYRRKPILASSECRAILHEIWERSAKLDGWWVGHYIVMPDHVHFFARPEVDAKPTAKWVQTWKGISSRRILKALNARSPIWQADYFDRYLRSTESYSEKWDYVAQNAVRAGLVPRAEDWPYRGYYPRSDVVASFRSQLAPVWSRHALVPVAEDIAAVSPYGLRAGRLHYLRTAKVFPGTGRGKTFELKSR